MSARAPARDAEQAMTEALLGAGRASAGATPIIDLGRHLAAVRRAHNLFDEANLAGAKIGGSARGFKDALELLFERVNALQGLIATQPALSLSDAAVVIAEAATAAALLAADGSMPDEAVSVANKIERMLLGALPFVAHAAGLDMAAMEWTEGENLRVSRFRAMGAQS
jgi:hypothetical protein